MDGGGNGRIHFGDFELDPLSGKLFREGRPVKIQPQPLRVLGVLVERAGETVSSEQLRTRVWGDATFVEFDQGLNYCVRQIRLALRDGASEPLYIETLPKQGYRFIAHITVAPGVPQREAAPGPPLPAPPDPELLHAAPTALKRSAWYLAAGILALLAIGGMAVHSSLPVHPPGITYTQLTDFTDSALAPTLSPDGRLVAFIRGDSSFLTADQIYVKVLPNGESRRLTDDSRLKYNLAFTPDGAQIAYTVLQLPSWATYTVSVFGGDSHLFLNNAAGLTWLDQRRILYSRTRSGQHMGIVTGTTTGHEIHELYFPPHERAMAHYSSASPDRKMALVVEMDDKGGWSPCRLISLDGRFEARPIGPQGLCRSAGWSPDGSWMYFTVSMDGHSRL
jgi:DNA-binding winged helix-turn-helix (wHTH) protein